MICRARDSNAKAAQAVHRACGVDIDEIVWFAKTFHLSNVSSIDAFLTRNPQHRDIGKALIAVCLIELEEPRLFHDERAKYDDDWYHYLWNVLIDDTNTTADLANNKVRFITFNYDRSLEFFLRDSTKHTYARDRPEDHKKWSQLEILHVYGDLGKFPIGDEIAGDERNYSNKLFAPAVKIAVDRIHVMPEDRGFEETFKKTQEWCDWASRIYFLGFGFDKLNCERLGFANILDVRTRRGEIVEVTASAHEMTQAEFTRAKVRATGSRGKWTDPQFKKNVETLRYGPLLV